MGGTLSLHIERTGGFSGCDARLKTIGPKEEIC